MSIMATCFIVMAASYQSPDRALEKIRVIESNCKAYIEKTRHIQCHALITEYMDDVIRQKQDVYSVHSATSYVSVVKTHILNGEVVSARPFVVLVNKHQYGYGVYFILSAEEGSEFTGFTSKGLRFRNKWLIQDEAHRSHGQVNSLEEHMFSKTRTPILAGYQYIAGSNFGTADILNGSDIDIDNVTTQTDCIEIRFHGSPDGIYKSWANGVAKVMKGEYQLLIDSKADMSFVQAKDTKLVSAHSQMSYSIMDNLMVPKSRTNIIYAIDKNGIKHTIKKQIEYEITKLGAR